MSETLDPVAMELDQRQLAERLLAQAGEQGVEPVGPNGLLAEMTEHLGYDERDPSGRGRGNSRNDTRAKTVLTEIGPVEIELPGDVKSSFGPQIVKKRPRRLTGIAEIVLSVTAKGLTAGELAAHFADVYGDTISRITDEVVAEMGEWCNRPLCGGLKGLPEAITRVWDRAIVRPSSVILVGLMGAQPSSSGPLVMVTSPRGPGTVLCGGVFGALATVTIRVAIAESIA